MIDDGEPAAALLRAYNSLIAGDCVRFAGACELPAGYVALRTFTPACHVFTPVVTGNRSGTV